MRYEIEGRLKYLTLTASLCSYRPVSCFNNAIPKRKSLMESTWQHGAMIEKSQGISWQQKKRRESIRYTQDIALLF